MPIESSARDMTMGYAIAQDTHKALLPFKVPKGMCETDIAVRLFDHFRNLYSLFMRVTQEERLKDQMRCCSNSNSAQGGHVRTRYILHLSDGAAA